MKSRLKQWPQRCSLLLFCLHHSQVSDLNSQLHMSVDKVRLEREELMDQLHHLSAENTSTKLDNQRLKVGESSSISFIWINYYANCIRVKCDFLLKLIKGYCRVFYLYIWCFQGLLMSSEEKLKDLQTEARHLKASLKKQENLVEKYKKKVESATTL